MSYYLPGLWNHDMRSKCSILSTQVSIRSNRSGSVVSMLPSPPTARPLSWVSTVPHSCLDNRSQQLSSIFLSSPSSALYLSSLSFAVSQPSLDTSTYESQQRFREILAVSANYFPPLIAILHFTTRYFLLLSATFCYFPLFSAPPLSSSSPTPLQKSAQLDFEALEPPRPLCRDGHRLQRQLR